jgi:hypothetical protein
MDIKKRLRVSWSSTVWSLASLGVIAVCGAARRGGRGGVGWLGGARHRREACGHAAAQDARSGHLGCTARARPLTPAPVPAPTPPPKGSFILMACISSFVNSKRDVRDIKYAARNEEREAAKRAPPAPYPGASDVEMAAQDQMMGR